MFFENNLSKVVDASFVKIFAAQHSIPICSQNLKNAIVNCEHRNIKGAATQVIHQNIFLSSICSIRQSIRNRS